MYGLDSSLNGALGNVNANPAGGWCWDGHLAKMCSFADMDWVQILVAILDAYGGRLDREYSQAGGSKEIRDKS